MKKLPTTLKKANEELTQLREEVSIMQARIREIEKVKIEIENKEVLKELRSKNTSFEEMINCIRSLQCNREENLNE